MLHVPKTGGTAIMEALKPVAGQYGLVFEPHEVGLADIPEHHRVFAFLRHPVERFVSGFNSRLRRGQPRYLTEWTPEEARSFADFATANALAESLTSSNLEIADLARSAMSSIRFVNDSFAHWFGSIENLRSRRGQFVLLGLQSCLDKDFEVLKARLEIPSEIRLPSEDILSHKTPQQFDRTLSSLGRKNVSDWYAAEIAFYEEYAKLRMEWFGLAPDRASQQQPFSTGGSTAPIRTSKLSIASQT